MFYSMIGLLVRVSRLSFTKLLSKQTLSSNKNPNCIMNTNIKKLQYREIKLASPICL